RREGEREMSGGGEPRAGPVSGSGSATVRRGRAWRLSQQERLAYTLLVPVLGTLAVVVTYPFLVAVVQSVTSATGAFVGLQNYARALENPLLYEALRVTATYAAIVLP